MNNSVSIIVVLVVAIVALLLVFRGCRSVDIRQKSNDNKTEFTVEVQKTKNA